MTFCALPPSSAASCAAEVRRSREMFRNSSMSRDVIRIALGSAGRSKNLRRSRTIVSIFVIIPRSHTYPFHRLRGRSLCGGRSPVKGGPTAVASGDCSLDRVCASPCFASMQTTAGFPTYAAEECWSERMARLRAVANVALMNLAMHP